MTLVDSAMTLFHGRFVLQEFKLHVFQNVIAKSCWERSKVHGETLVK